jgi:DNA-directed RNA polymerase subunit H (RpoH/RPB5)
MAVKSSTKKRLIELGIPEDHAHKLADDANLDAIKRMSREQVAKKVGIEEGVSELDHIMTVISEHVGSRKRSKSNRITISRKALLDEDIPTGDYRFNVLNHFLVPHHELVPIESEAEILEPWGLTTDDAFGTGRLAKELLPKILITDPAIQVIKEMEESENDELPAGWLANRVVKVVRYSRSAGNSVAFRLIVESA